jgi:FMN phosphatase YigB (HAD superfamily)
MKVVLFDLGQTLENNGTLRDDAIEILKYIKSLKDANDQPPILGLASDNEFPNTTRDQAPARYYSLLTDRYKIADFFEPLVRNVTLSKDVGVTKDENLPLFMQKAIDKIDNTSFNELIFITENKTHIDKANSIGIKTIFLNLDNIPTNEGQYTIRNLRDAKNILEDLINEGPVNLSNKS